MELELQLKERWLVSLTCCVFTCQPLEHFSTANINNDKQRLLSVAPWFQLCSLSGVQTSLVGTNPPSWGVPSHAEITIHLGLPFTRNCLMWKYESESHSVLSDSATLWTVAHQAPLPMGFSRLEYWSGLPFPSPGDLPGPEIEPRSPALQADALLSELLGKPKTIHLKHQNFEI